MSELLPLPNVIFFGGRKKSGKDFICDFLVRERGYTKLHIAEPWLRGFCERHSLTWEHYSANKHLYRAQVQAEAEQARAENPNVLIEMLGRELDRRRGELIVVSGIRFINEALFAIWNGHLMVKVEVDDETRRQRFIEAGESLELFDDPFEREIDEMPYHLLVPGNLEAWRYEFLLSGGYIKLMLEARQMMKEVT